MVKVPVDHLTRVQYSGRNQVYNAVIDGKQVTIADKNGDGELSLADGDEMIGQGDQEALFAKFQVRAQTLVTQFKADLPQHIATAKKAWNENTETDRLIPFADMCDMSAAEPFPQAISRGNISVTYFHEGGDAEKDTADILSFMTTGKIAIAVHIEGGSRAGDDQCLQLDSARAGVAEYLSPFDKEGPAEQFGSDEVTDVVSFPDIGFDD